MSGRVLVAVDALIFMCLIAACVASEPDRRTTARHQDALRLNNLVAELLRLDLSSARRQVRELTQPRDGWVFFKVPREASDDGARVWVTLDGVSREQAILGPGASRDGEVMRYLSAGTHRVEVWAEQGAAGVLVVRTIPEIIFIHFTGDLHSPDGSPFKPSVRSAHGADRFFLYYWDWLDRHILKNVNVIQGGSQDNPFMPAWLAQGRREIVGGHFFSKNPAELQSRWEDGFRPPFSGVLVDEFVPPTGDISLKDRDLGGYRPGLGFEPQIMDVIKRLSADAEHKGTFYAYLGVPSAAKAENCRLLMETLMACHGRWVWEAYLWEQPSEAAAMKYLETAFRQRMLDFRRTFPGSERNCIVCPAILEAWDSLPDFDFKVWLDLQFQMLAVDPAFAGIYGVTAYQSTSADPELMSWLSRLFRHYCIEGKTELVSSPYGYRLRLKYLQNPGFTDGANGWTVAPAEPGSIQVRSTAKLPIKKGYLPKGGHVLVMRRNGVKPNRISQEIRDLRPGSMYSLRLYCCDLTDLTTRKKHAQSVRLDGVTLLGEHSRQDIQQGDGAGANGACWNYTYRVFRAVTNRGRLEISDWSDATTPGGPAGRETLFDFVQIQPLFEPE
jgi:hypothetical protein